MGSDNSSTGYVQQIVKLLSVDNNVWPLSAFLIYIYTHTYIKNILYMVGVVHLLVWIIFFFPLLPLCVCVDFIRIHKKKPVHSDSHFLLSLFITCLYPNPFSAAAPQLSFIHLSYGLPPSIFQTISTRTLYLAFCCLPSLGRDRTA